GGGGGPARHRRGAGGRPVVRAELRRHDPAGPVRSAALRRRARAVPRGVGGYRDHGDRADAGGAPPRAAALGCGLARRGRSGRPGPRYWQQRADYPIRAALDTATHTIAGSETIHYTNNSPDTLAYLWLQLDQNIYRAASRGAAINPTDARFAGRGFEGGYTIQYVRAVQRFGKASGRAPLATRVNGTVMRAELDRPLPPGQAATLELAYSFEVPEHCSDRMGREQFPGGWLYEIAQWYPRLAVYD